jgi:hypothetical protein
LAYIATIWANSTLERHIVVARCAALTPRRRRRGKSCGPALGAPVRVELFGRRKQKKAKIRWECEISSRNITGHVCTCGQIAGTGIAWVLLVAVDNIREGDDGPRTPRRGVAAHIVEDRPLFCDVLTRTLGMDPRQRDSIALTMRKAVTLWMRLALRGIEYPAFDDSFLSDPVATLCVLTAAEGSIAGAAVALLEHLVKL